MRAIRALRDNGGGLPRGARRRLAVAVSRVGAAAVSRRGGPFVSRDDSAIEWLEQTASDRGAILLRDYSAEVVCIGCTPAIGPPAQIAPAFEHDWPVIVETY